MVGPQVCPFCQGWNPWHHPYTVHAAWCRNYVTESPNDRRRNQDYWDRGGYYELGYPKDGR